MSGAEPAKDVGVEAEGPSVWAGTAAVTIQAHPGTVTTTVRRWYEVRYLWTVHDNSRMDALQMQLRVFQPSPPSYFQYVTASIPAPELRGFVPDRDVTRGQLEHGVALETLSWIADAIHRGAIPLAKKIDGFEVSPDIETGVRLARAGHIGEIAEGDIVGEPFEVDTPEPPEPPTDVPPDTDT